MGDLGEVLCWGFICRLCSKMHRDVTFITDRSGQETDLMDRINAYLPVSITPTDPLPKTICGSCNQKIQQHHQLMEQIKRVQLRFQEIRNEELAKIKARKKENRSQPSTSAMIDEAGPSCSKARPATEQGLIDKPPKRPRLDETQDAGSSAIPTAAAVVAATPGRPSAADCNVFLLNDDEPGPSRPRPNRATTTAPSANLNGSPNDCSESSGISFKQPRPLLTAPTPNTDDSD